MLALAMHILAMHVLVLHVLVLLALTSPLLSTLSVCAPP